jgi:murein DD-endopeptidase MepM/ murein hydrolase activator NlpD
MAVSTPRLKFNRPLHGPDHKDGPSVGEDVLAVKRVLWRWDPFVFPGPALKFDDVFNRRIVNALRVAQDFWNLDVTGELDEPTFERMRRARRERGDRKPEESAWDAVSIKLYKEADQEPVRPEKCFLLPAGARVRRGGGVSSHMSRPLGNWQSDNAIDVHAAPLTPILAPKAGVVTRIGGRDPHEGPTKTIFGEHITITCPDGDAFFFTHTDRIVGIGERVVAGQVIARIADWPNSKSMDHVHVGRISGRNPEELYDWPEFAPRADA